MPSSSFSSMSERLSPRTYSHPTLDPEILEVDEHNSNDSSSLINSTKSIGSSEADGSGGQQFPDVHKPASRFHKMCITISLGVLFIGAVTFLVVLFALPSSSSCEDAVGATSCDIFCSGLILQTIQFGGLFNDSKTFVDMPLTRHPQCVKDDFESMEDYSKESLYEFLLRNFEPSCTDMLLWQPSDYLPTPPFLAQIKDSAIADWACDLNGLWNLLGRALDPDVYRHPERHTLLPLRSPYMIVPGGRFCEFYYWDSYWIIQGLLVSDMIDTAKGIVENFLGLVADYGFVPNGSRRYYLNRSQPPMLTLMVKEVYEYTGDVEWLKSALPILELEYQFWMEPDTRAVKIVDENGDAHILNRYYTDNKLPRPESYVQDQLTAWLLHNMTHGEKMSDHMKERLKRFHFEKLELNHLNDAIRYQSSAAYHNLAHYTVDDDDDDVDVDHDDVDVDHDDVVDHDSNPSSSVGGGPARRLRDAVIPPSPVPSFHNESNIELLFAEIAAAAESGWDFSSRWFHDRFNLTSVETMDLIPVDLNAIMYAVEKNIGQFFAIIDDRKKASAYAQRAADRMVAIDSVLWNSETNQWNDYHIDRDEWKKEVVISNFVPLWTKCYDTSIVNEGAVISSLLASGLVMDGGLVTTLNNNTQQWDFPNAWAPIQWMVNEGIASSRYRSASSYDNFHIYNSTLLKPGEPIPSHACDIARPEEWANCTASVTTGAADGEGVTTESKSESDMINIDCVWCFPPPEDLSKALSFRWLLSNYVAFNHTGYMLEKYYAPIVGGAGEGGEYHLQKGFGWSNGVALGWIAKYTNDTEFHIDKMSTHPFPYSRMAAPEVYDKLSLPESPLLTHPLKDQVESQIYHRSHTHGYKPNNNSTLSSHSKMNMKKKMMMKKKKRHHRERQRQDDEGSQYSPVGYPTTNNNNIVRQVLV